MNGSASGVAVGVGSADDAIEAAVAAVCDPEYPDVTIAELGILESVTINGSSVRVELVPTVLGCPALQVIEADVVAAARSAGATRGRGGVRVQPGLDRVPGAARGP